MAKPILTMDFETDPFSHGRRVKPFACGVYDGKNFASVWSKNCARVMVEKYLANLEPSIIYMHNGGRFDIFFLMKWLEAEMRIINGRIVQAWLGHHELRDSYAILPIALKQYAKDDIDITKLEESVRLQHKAEILSYLRGDCVYLHELVTGFRDEFGDFLTIGSAAMNQLRKFHPFDCGNKYLDDKFRKTFFFGGRVQCFQSGIINTRFEIHDVNSMYPDVMKNKMHPIGNAFEVDRHIGKKTQFIVVEGSHTGPYGCFPIRNKRGGIDFNSESGTFATTIHEFNAAEQNGWFKCRQVKRVYNFDESICFDEFVTHFYDKKVLAKKLSDKRREIFYKLIQNSAYGKFAQNPDNYKDFIITHGEQLPTPWAEKFIHVDGEYIVWEKPVQRHSYYNVAVGASITGAARAQLLLAMKGAQNLIYCDTDSIISAKLTGVTISDTELGAWKFEGAGDRMAIAGKKLYACYDSTLQGPVERHEEMGFARHQTIKKATKGARIGETEIARVARGETVTYKKDSPTFKLDGRVDFITRRIQRTV